MLIYRFLLRIFSSHEKITTWPPDSCKQEKIEETSVIIISYVSQCTVRSDYSVIITRLHCYYHKLHVAVSSAEVLKSTMRKSSPNLSSTLQPRAPPSSTLLMKASAGNTLTPLGPLGLSLREDDSSSTSVRPRRHQPAGDSGYSTDELQVLRSSYICCLMHCSCSYTLCTCNLWSCNI